MKNVNRYKINMEENNNIDYSYLLTKFEYNQLEVFNRVDDFSRMYNALKNKNQNFGKYDVLWTVYNDARVEYERKKDTVMLSIVFDRLSDILIYEKKYEQALQFFAVSLYLILYEYEFDLHLNNRRKEKLKKLLLRTNISLLVFEGQFVTYVQDNIYNLYDNVKAKFIVDNIIKRIK